MKISIPHIPLYFTCFFPLIWLMGIEQLIIVPFMIGYSFFLAYKTRVVLPLDRFEWTFLLFFFLSILSLPYANNFGAWLRTSISFFTCFSFLYFIRVYYTVFQLEHYNTIFKKIGCILLFFTLFSFIIFLVIPSLKITTLLSPIFPSGSDFFQSLKFKSFGATYDNFGSGINRFSGPFVSYSSMSMAGLLLFSYILSSEFSKTIKFLLFITMTLALLATESRLAIYSYMLLLLFILIILMRLTKRDLILPIIMVVMSVFLVVLLLYGVTIYDYLYYYFFEYRSESSSTRLRIYEATFEGIYQKPIVGWGNSRELEGTFSRYSAGTHSSYLSLAFIYGIPAAIIYGFFWFGIYKDFLKKVIFSNAYGFHEFSFLLCLLVFSIREIADTWWWDHLLLFLFCVHIINYRNEQPNIRRF